MKGCLVRRALLIPLAATAALAITLTTSPQMATADGILRPHIGVTDCDAGTLGIETFPENYEEAQYNDDLTLCDWGLGSGQPAEYSFKNESPVVWVFYDSIYTQYSPSSGRLHFKTTGIVPLFRDFALSSEVWSTPWIVSPGETVWLDSLVNVSFGIASPLVNSSWLLYKHQAAKVAALGKSYAKRIATTKYESKTRTFLWECVAAGITASNSLSADSKLDAIDFASSWLTTAKSVVGCKGSFKSLFPKKPPKLPASTTSLSKWFDPKTLNTASKYIDDIDKSRTAIAEITHLFHFRVP